MNLVQALSFRTSHCSCITTVLEFVSQCMLCHSNGSFNSTEFVHFVLIPVCIADWQVMCIFKALWDKGHTDENLSEEGFCYFYKYCDFGWKLVRCCRFVICY